jgi:hypothetical protein
MDTGIVIIAAIVGIVFFRGNAMAGILVMVGLSAAMSLLAGMFKGHK